nr:MAG TPA: hypothetical protein [Caudoviricetes sp.]
MASGKSFGFCLDYFFHKDNLKFCHQWFFVTCNRVALV